MVERCPDKTEVHGSIPCTRTMNPMEMGPQINSNEKEPENLAAENAESFDGHDFEKLMNWVKQSFQMWAAIEKGDEPALPTDPEEAQSYVDKFEYLKEHNQEKYRDADGIEFYKRLDHYIEKLKTVK